MAREREVRIEDIPREELEPPPRHLDVFVKGATSKDVTPSQVLEAQRVQREAMREKLRSERDQALKDARSRFQEDISRTTDRNERLARERQFNLEKARITNRFSSAIREGGLAPTQVELQALETKRVQALREEAGTVGQDLGRAEEIRRIQELPRQRQREEIARAIREERAVRITPEGVLIEQPKQPQAPESLVSRGELFFKEKAPGIPSGKGTAIFLTTPEDIAAREEVIRREQQVLTFIPRKITAAEKALGLDPLSPENIEKRRKLEAEGKRIPDFLLTPQERIAATEEARRRVDAGLPVNIFAGSELFGRGVVRTGEFVTQTKLSPEVRASLGRTVGDIALMSFFAPALSSGVAAKKVKAKKGVRQKAIQVKKTKATSGLRFTDDAIDATRQAWISGNREAVRNIYRRALESGNKVAIKQTEKIIIEAIGKNNAATLFKDVAAQQAAIRGVGVTTAKEVPFASVAEPTQSVFAGKGLFDISEFARRTLPKQQPTFKLEEISATRFGVFAQQKSALSTAPVVAGRFAQVQLTPQTALEKQKVVLATALGLRLGTAQKQVQLQKQILRLQTSQVPVLRTTPIPKPKFPGVPPVVLPSIIVTPEMKKALAKKIKEKFSVFIRRKGKDIKIKEVKTIEKAEKVLKSELRETLAASGFITKDGQRVQPLFFGQEFRPAKRDQFRIVQRRGFRLGTLGEVSEIQMFKRRSPKKRRGMFGL